MQSLIQFRTGTFDSAHRVMDERFKCYNLHGHTYRYELHFRVTKLAPIGYAVDFKEIKRVHMEFIDRYLDHGTIVNPQDAQVIDLCKRLNSKLWIMGVGTTPYFNEVNAPYINPTVENICREIYFILAFITNILFKEYIFLEKIVLYETPTCASEYTTDSSAMSSNNLPNTIKHIVELFCKEVGVVEYDRRKLS